MKIEKKCNKEYFQDMLDGRKTFELRLADWDINEGDILVLREVDENRNYTGRVLEKVITYLIKTKDIDFFTKDKIDKYGWQVIGFK